MFNANFYPTPLEVIEQMTEGIDLQNKTVLEPSAGKGNIVDYLLQHGAQVIACENNEDLKKIAASKCKLIADDFLTVTSDQISHIDLIVMNPPFNEDCKHILHAFEIAPPGCKIISLCNLSTVENTYTEARKQLTNIIESFGDFKDLGNCFAQAERMTGVKVALIRLQKAGENYNTEFEGFFTDEEPEEIGENGIMSYNVVRDLVNRYVGAVKVYDEQLTAAVKMNNLTGSFFYSQLAFHCTEEGKPKARNEFKKDLQRAAWKWIFDKMNMQKHATQGLREDINKFVEQQTDIPFTMKNIYKMLEIVIGTTGNRMDKVILEAFDKATKHHHDNRYNVPGWKTNSHYLIGKKFILPYMVDPAKNYGYTSETYSVYNHRFETINDLEKALCFVTGKNYDEIKSLYQSANSNVYGQWYDSEFFKYKAYKKGSAHFEFKDLDIWAAFNQRVAKLKGYPLFEGKAQTKYQDRQTGRATQKKANPAHAYKPTVLFEIKVS